MALRNLWRGREAMSISSRCATLLLNARNFATSGARSGNSPPWPVFDNENVPLSLIDRGRMIKVRFKNQAEFQMFLERADAVGAAPPEEPNWITSKLCELDPKRIHVLVDATIVKRYAMKYSREKAEQQNCPTDIMTFLDKNYKVEDD